MHERSIAMSVVELAEAESERHSGLQITAVHLRLGLLTGVAKDPLVSSYEMACEDTALRGLRLVVEELPGVVYCPACDQRRLVRSSEWFCCSESRSLASEIVRGGKLEVVSLEIE